MKKEQKDSPAKHLRLLKARGQQKVVLHEKFCGRGGKNNG